MIDHSELPVAVVGAGPVGLAAAAHLMERGIEPLVLEAGSRVAASMRDWGHVKLFTPWSYLIDPASRRLLEAQTDWREPNAKTVPLGTELIEQYLDPLAQLIGERIRLQHRVVGVTRVGHDRMRNGEREAAPFQLVVDTPEGRQRFVVRAVIDASGTWTTPNPMGAGGLEADGEREHRAHIRYGIPDVLGAERSRYADKRILVVGSGHSAIGTVLNLAELAAEHPETLIAWGTRRHDPAKLWGGGAADELADRGALGTRVREVVHAGQVALLPGLSISAVKAHATGLEVVDTQGKARVVVDEIVVAAGSRPDLSMLRELRLDLDLSTESTKTLGPLIDPNYHSCGSVPPHGAEELAHPEERDFYVVGMKSYGRAPTFLLRTGYEQVRSVVAAIAGAHEDAARVELVLPETGVCSTSLSYGGDEARSPRGACC